jgi:ribonuclease VapC
VIAIDTSALMAIDLLEPRAQDVHRALQIDGTVWMSAATLVESQIVSRRRKVSELMSALIENISPDIVPVTAEFATLAVAAHDAYGKGVHPAGLNFGDCFAYALAKSRSCPLLYVGDDFAKTDVKSALTRP